MHDANLLKLHLNYRVSGKKKTDHSELLKNKSSVSSNFGKFKDIKQKANAIIDVRC